MTEETNRLPLIDKPWLKYSIDLPNRELEKMTAEEKIKYFNALKAQAMQYKDNPRDRKNMLHKLVARLAPLVRNYDFEVIGIENIPPDKKALFMCNHSNSHEFYTLHEAFDKVGTNISAFAASDGLGGMIDFIFRKSSTIVIDRKSKQSVNEGMLLLASKIMNGEHGALFGESTWNLHPYQPMLPIKIGGAKIAAIAEVPIIPTIIEYVEVPYRCKWEKEIYSKCIVKFGKPIQISREESLITQTEIIYNILTEMRLDLWRGLGCLKLSVNDVNQEVYLNHTYLKKFDGLEGWIYDSERESKYLRQKNGLPTENEYHLDGNGNFVAGILTKEEGKNYCIG